MERKEGGEREIEGGNIKERNGDSIIIIIIIILDPRDSIFIFVIV